MTYRCLTLAVQRLIFRRTWRPLSSCLAWSAACSSSPLSSCSASTAYRKIPSAFVEGKISCSCCSSVDVALCHTEGKMNKLAQPYSITEQILLGAICCSLWVVESIISTQRKEIDHRCPLVRLKLSVDLIGLGWLDWAGLYLIFYGLSQFCSVHNMRWFSLSKLDTRSLAIAKRPCDCCIILKSGSYTKAI